MSQLKVNTIRHTGASSDNITLASDGTATAKITNISNRNLVINGSMQVWQRSTSSLTSGYGTVDRWKDTAGNIGQNATKSRGTLSSSDGPWADGHKYYHRKTLAGAGNANSNAEVSLETVLESQDIANSGWSYKSSSSYITLSFWARVSTGQTFYMYVYNPDSGYVYLKDFALSSNTWTKVSYSIPGNSNLVFDLNEGAGLQLRILQFYGTGYTNNRSTESWATYAGTNFAPDMASTWLTAGASTFDLTGVQLEVGDYATDFEHRSYGDELARCQRYYYAHISALDSSNSTLGLGMYYSSSRAMMYVKFPVSMRTTPTAEITDVSNGYQLWVGGTYDFVDEFHIDTTNAGSVNGCELESDSEASGTTGYSCYVRRYTADTKQFSFSAEL